MTVNGIELCIQREADWECRYNESTTEFSYLYFNHRYYYVSNAPATEQDLDEVIEQVQRNIQIQQKEQLSGDANELAVGTKIYTSKDYTIEQAVIVEDGAQYRWAYITMGDAGVVVD